MIISHYFWGSLVLSILVPIRFLISHFRNFLLLKCFVRKCCGATLLLYAQSNIKAMHGIVLSVELKAFLCAIFIGWTPTKTKIFMSHLIFIILTTFFSASFQVRHNNTIFLECIVNVRKNHNDYGPHRIFIAYTVALAISVMKSISNFQLQQHHQHQHSGTGISDGSLSQKLSPKWLIRQVWAHVTHLPTVDILCLTAHHVLFILQSNDATSAKLQIDENVVQSDSSLAWTRNHVTWVPMEARNCDA